jgi:hypothetical protein
MPIANVGHSLAAGGHGNFEIYLYLAVLSWAIQPIFSSIGIEFELHNYGMTSMPLGLELALCIKYVYGMAINLLR